ncbi:Conserved_hypothetical protein [Hexamita inflata]|uniref:Uncharacterized protein n=1 Tax=Hexamita inflata TaxID=28002 RepID=A0AA86V2F0_9EUKA|nr:Conserved hypothetical protein [Hexamita inflata]
MKSVPYEYLAQKSVRGTLLNMTLIFKQDGSNTLISQYSLADPAGMIPAMIYNRALDSRNDLLLLIKNHVEGTEIIE